MTPGPWLFVLSDCYVVHEEAELGRSGIHRTVIVPRVFGRSRAPLAEGVANGLLIAAAPDLLEAARYAVDYPRADDARDRLDVAIAKAEGRNP